MWWVYDPAIVPLQALPELQATPRAWPQFTVDTPPPTNRTSLAAAGAVVPASVQARFAPPIDVDAGLAAEAARATSGNGAALDSIAILLIVIVALLAASLAGILWWCLIARRHRQEVAVMTKEAMLASGSSGSSGIDTTTVSNSTAHPTVLCRRGKRHLAPSARR